MKTTLNAKLCPSFPGLNLFGTHSNLTSTLSCRGTPPPFTFPGTTYPTKPTDYLLAYLTAAANFSALAFFFSSSASLVAARAAPNLHSSKLARHGRTHQHEDLAAHRSRTTQEALSAS